MTRGDDMSGAPEGLKRRRERLKVQGCEESILVDWDEETNTDRWYCADEVDRLVAAKDEFHAEYVRAAAVEDAARDAEIDRLRVIEKLYAEQCAALSNYGAEIAQLRERLARFEQQDPVEKRARDNFNVAHNINADAWERQPDVEKRRWRLEAEIQIESMPLPEVTP